MTRRATLAAVLVVLALSAACGGLRPRGVALPPGGVALPVEGVWRARVVDGGRERFAGLLVTHREGKVVHYGLLDGTGIKLLQGNVVQGGGDHLEGVAQPVRHTRLPEYLARAVARIFLPGPGGGECVRRGWARVCESIVSPQVVRRTSVFGPFPLWSVEYTLGGTQAAPTVDRVAYAPWGQPHLHLQRLP